MKRKLVGNNKELHQLSSRETRREAERAKNKSLKNGRNK